MPLISIKMWEGRTQEQKQELIEVFTREMARICKTDKKNVIILIDDKKRSNWAEGGIIATELED